MSRTERADDRTERILRLKEFERNNKNRMNTVSGIMGYTPYKEDDSAGKNEDVYAEESSYGNQAKEFKNSFKFRLIFCILLFALAASDRFWLHKLPKNIYQDAEKEIGCDYSAGIIDFINKFPYTLKYEETGVR